MKLIKLFAGICFLIGCIFFIIGFLEGDLQVGLIVFIPFLLGTGVWAGLGFLFLFASFILYIIQISSFQSHHLNNYDTDTLFKYDDNRMKSEKKTKGIILIGPIPIVFGFEKKTSIILVILLVIIGSIILFLSLNL